ncbi:MAG TPA: hypothetical protein VGK00_10990 [Anaerolineales bacterium]|jgi:hypothetical protein
MKTNISKTISHSLLVDSDDILSIHSFISSKYNRVIIVGKCNDGSQLEITDIQDLLQFENLNYRKIESITFYAGNNNGEDEEKFSLNIQDRTFYSSELIVSSNDDQKALYVTQEILKRLADTKPSYDWVARISVLTALLIFLLSLWFVLQASVYLKIIHIQGEISDGVGAFNNAIFFAIILIAITYPIDRLRKYLYPKLFFLLGKQKKTIETIRFWRNFIFVTVILTIILGIAVNVITNLFLK